MLKTRVMTALVMLAVLLPILFLAPVEALKALLIVIIGCAAWEWSRLLWPQKHTFNLFYSIALMLFLGIWWSLESLGSLRVLLSYLQLIIIAAAFLFWIIFVPRIMKAGLQFSLLKWRTLLAWIGYLIFPACWFALLILRDLGLLALLSVLVWVWAADIGAYFAGRGFGRHKLAPSLSPGKTIEGLIGGMIAVLLVAITAALYQNQSITYFSWIQNRLGWVGMLAIALAGGLLSVMGDLFESQLKRLAGVKDSSNLLPGHGGFLDRIDALLPVLPFAALIVLSLV